MIATPFSSSKSAVACNWANCPTNRLGNWARWICSRCCWLAGKPSPGPFVYRHQGNLATIGRSAAVVDFGWIKLKGAIAWWVWGIAHIYFLIGTRNRLMVSLNWLWIYLRDQRSARNPRRRPSDQLCETGLQTERSSACPPATRSTSSTP